MQKTVLVSVIALSALAFVTAAQAGANCFPRDSGSASTEKPKPSTGA